MSEASHLLPGMAGSKHMESLAHVKVVHLSSVHSPFDLRIFVKECRSLAQAGFHVTIVAPHFKDEVVENVHIKQVRPATGGGRVLRMTVTAWNVLREALKQDADIYQFHDPELIPAALFLRALGKTVIYDAHENLPKDILLKQYLPFWSRRALSWVMGKLEVSASKRLSALVTVSPVIADRFVISNPRTTVIHNFPDVGELTVCGEIPWKSRKPLVVFPGGILPERGIRQMVYAMACLPESVNATLEIASSDFPADLWAELSEHPGWNRVRFLGRLDRAQIVNLLGRASAGLVPYLPEEQNLCALPHKLFEYMAAGIPVIASDFPLWRRVLQGTDCTIFVDPLRPEAIAGAILYVLNNPAECERMGRNGREAVRASFNWDSQARELVKLYRGLLESPCVG